LITNKSIFITGASGFVGKNLKFILNSKYIIFDYIKNSKININQNIIIHLAGKAHDLKNTSNSNEYYDVNTELTKNIFNAFLNSDAKVFIFLSSVKSVADFLDCELTESYISNPITHYGKSKLFAEDYILSKKIPAGKRFYILRPCMIHGPGNKGNLNLLYKIVSKGVPWPLGAFENKRSFCSIDNLCFIINELIENDNIQSGVYNVADNEALSTNDLIRLIAESQGKNSYILNIPKFIIKSFTKLGDLLRLPLNTERLQKLTETYIVSNQKIKNAINKPLPVSAKDGLMKTLNSFGNSKSL
jgi:nucleoside-diphosphate-sugar epimerase